MSRPTFLNRLRQITAPSRRRTAPKFARRPCVGGMEALEDRKLMTVSDLADAAALVVRPNPGTNLYINFDGGSVPTVRSGDPQGLLNYNIRPFEKEAGDGALNRERDIQDILYQVSEVYSPFDVKVHRIYGSGNYSQSGGDTTIFVGANDKNATATVDGNGLLFNYKKYVSAETPPAYDDGQRLEHKINSNPYDIAFVDPTYGSTNNPALIVASIRTETTPGDPTRADIFDIRRSIAHEAGHTFGLEHVRSDGNTDPTPIVPGSGTVPDVQAYDTRNVRFANQSLTLTTANQTPDGVKFELKLPQYFDFEAWRAVTLSTENSYRTLGNVLGYRPQNEGTALVADAATVDASIGAAALSKADVSNATIRFASLDRTGDFQAYTFTTSDKAVGLSFDQVSVVPTVGGLNPEILVYDKTGTVLNSVVKADGNGRAILSDLHAGNTYTLVVGGVDGNSTGAYYLSIDHFVVDPRDIERPVITSLSTTTPLTGTPIDQSFPSLVAPPLTAAAPDLTFVSTTTGIAASSKSAAPRATTPQADDGTRDSSADPALVATATDEALAEMAAYDPWDSDDSEDDGGTGLLSQFPDVSAPLCRV